MRWQRLCFVSLVALLWSGLAPCVVHAGAYDQLIDAAGGSVPSVPDVPEPTPVYEDDSSNSGNENTPLNNFWSNFWNPQVDPVYEQQQREKRQKAREERARKRKEAAKRRKDAREDREWEEKQRRKAEAAKVRGFVPPPRQPRATPPSLRPPTAKVPAGTEATALAENQFRMATLLKKGNLTPQEKQLLEQLHDVCRALWAKAVVNENLTAIERSRIKINVPPLDFEDSQTAAKLADQLAQIKANLAAGSNRSLDLLKKYNKEKFQQLAEQAAGEVAENLGDNASDSLEKYLGAAKVSAAISRGDIPEAGKEVLDFLVGRLSSPRAGMAVEGGRMYASTVFRALDDFMIKAMGAVGKDFNTREFWLQVKTEMTAGQKTVMEFVGGHNGE
ncbi:MAG: hypothetical protein PHD82_11415 [Candidatus Riflebacteria bacterium]|nr:hypothetical protein [Candidatus Riflebacteria bacterium]